MENKTIFILGAAGLGAYFLLKNQGAVSLSTAIAPGQNGTPTVPNAPAPPLSYNDAYYKTYQYPALLAANPNLANPNYQLSPTDVTNYFNNYLELQQWWNGEANKQFPSLQAALQWHWKNAGVPLQYSFIPFTPPKNINWTPPPPVPKAQSGGFLSDALSVVTKIAPVLLAVAGPNDNVLNDADVQIIVSSGLIIKDILPFYLNVDKSLVNSINNRVDQLVSKYE